ncbi:hypothetical protein Slin15195_G130140 [Septoria linicola]|uniref:Uncharacterized protein n=1 Tax=Septoria linicola TaxID=215465 RepID=A0A9Q9B7H6_9PEZI|nr:hypothetical protein Slin14017_G122030 [Septoria linicola]USW59695.1 hypothetical protein Slin15195_G130140 [Septoria linicola]
MAAAAASALHSVPESDWLQLERYSDIVLGKVQNHGGDQCDHQQPSSVAAGKMAVPTLSYLHTLEQRMSQQKLDHDEQLQTLRAEIEQHVQRIDEIHHQLYADADDLTDRSARALDAHQDEMTTLRETVDEIRSTRALDAHQDEVAALRKTVDELRRRIDDLQASIISQQNVEPELIAGLDEQSKEQPPVVGPFPEGPRPAVNFSPWSSEAGGDKDQDERVIRDGNSSKVVEEGVAE